MATLIASSRITCASNCQDSYRPTHGRMDFTKLFKRSQGQGAESFDNSTAPSPLPSSNPFTRALSRGKKTRGQQATAELTQNSPSASLAPPPYTAQAAPAVSSSGPLTGATLPSPAPKDEIPRTRAHPILSVSEASTAEDPYAFLSSFDTVFLIDDSGSMSGRSWNETKEAVSAILPVIFEHDADGPDFYFMNYQTEDRGNSAEPWKAPTGFRNVTRSSGRSSGAEQLTVQEMFSQVSPWGATPTGQRLNHILRHYLRDYEDKVRETRDETCLKPLSIIVITDGAPSDEVGGVIKAAARRLDAVHAPAHQVGIQFFQVGNEPGAAAALQSLDDDLNRDGAVEIRDIVDTVTFSGKTNSVLTGDDILKVVLGSVIKRLDKVQANLRGGNLSRRHY